MRFIPMNARDEESMRPGHGLDTKAMIQALLDTHKLNQGGQQIGNAKTAGQFYLEDCIVPAVQQ